MMERATAAGARTTGTALDQIVERTLLDVARKKEMAPLDQVQAQLDAAGRSYSSLATALTAPHLSVIAEFKRASPSRGRFVTEIEPASMAAEYTNNGAAAISVLTDEPFFQGSNADLIAIANVVKAGERPVPVLRKDFILDPYQVWESAAIGADAILLITAVLHQDLLVSLKQLAESIGLSTLVEVHDGDEMERAVAADATVIGINNRDLHTFEVDLATTERLAQMAPAGTLIVSESGIFYREDCERLVAAGAVAVLVGEGLILAQDRGGLLRDFVSIPLRAKAI